MKTVKDKELLYSSLYQVSTCHICSFQCTVRSCKCGYCVTTSIPLSKGFNYLFTCIDCFTCSTETVTTANITAKTVAQAFINGWISKFNTMIPTANVTVITPSTPTTVTCSGHQVCFPTCLNL